MYVCLRVYVCSPVCQYGNMGCLIRADREERKQRCVYVGLRERERNDSQTHHPGSPM